MATAIHIAGPDLATTRWVAPQILRIDRYGLEPNTAAAIRNLQKQIALAMVRWDGIQPCLAAESLTGPQEVWCMTGFQSHDDQKRAAENLDRNEPLRVALDRVQCQLQVLTGPPAVEVAENLGNQANPWRMGHGHFLTITPAGGPYGSIYGNRAGVRFSIAATRTRREAEARAAASAGSQVFAVRAAWGRPAWHWILRDQEFWASSPVFKEAAPRSSQFRVVRAR